MNRRGFLSTLLAGVAGAVATQVLPEAVLDPERALWIPGQRTLFLPPERTFSTYSAADLDALIRSIGVLRFYGPGGAPRVTSYNRWRPDQSLALLSDQEARTAIDAGYALAPGLQSAIRAHGTGADLRALYTAGVSDHGRYTGRVYDGQDRRYGYGYGAGVSHPMGRTVYQHGQDLLHGPDDGHVTTQLTDRGIVVVGHRDRKGRL